MECSVELYQSFFDVPCGLRHVLIWIHFQQTLLAGVGASLAAWLTIRYIRKQIQQNEDHRQDDIKRQRKERATSLLYQITQASYDILGIKREIDKMLPRLDSLKSDHFAPHVSVINPISGFSQNDIIYNPN